MFQHQLYLSWKSLGLEESLFLLSCDLNSSTAIDTSRLRFYWQDKSGKVLYSFNKGEENQHQDNLYTNRTKAFGSEMSSGNISIKLSQVTLEDKQNVYWAFPTLFDENDKHILELIKCVPYPTCGSTVPTPSVTVNKTNMNATCSTQGGYPQPVVTWTSRTSYWLRPHSGPVGEYRPKDNLILKSGLLHRLEPSEYKRKSDGDLPYLQPRSERDCEQHNHRQLQSEH
nr:butyrophilin-like protein 10 [Salvelinus alpinus]